MRVVGQRNEEEKKKKERRVKGWDQNEEEKMYSE